MIITQLPLNKKWKVRYSRLPTEARARPLFIGVGSSPVRRLDMGFSRYSSSRAMPYNTSALNYKSFNTNPSIQKRKAFSPTDRSA
jgi:hypothetical protein